jgi:DNA-binding MarR family transcriptional regulator
MQKLVQKQLVVVAPDQNDARARLVSLSTSGETRLGEAVKILKRTDEAFRADNPEINQKLFDALRAAVEVKIKDVDEHPEQLGAMPR